MQKLKVVEQDLKEYKLPIMNIRHMIPMRETNESKTPINMFRSNSMNNTSIQLNSTV